MFSEDILEFQNLAGMWRNLIHNNPELVNVQKLHYLKDAVKGPPAQLIKDFHMIDAS